MKKVFVFCIGGTGERVMKSITMLMAAGMSTHGYTVVPIIIDPHLDLNEKKNLQTLMLKYGEIQKSMLLDGKCPEGFFNSEMKLIDELDTVTNDKNKVAGEDRSYADFLDMGNLDVSSINNYLIHTLYSKDNLNSRLSVGFRGNPNVGTVVLQEMLEGASWFNFLKTQIGKDDRVFIISSIFGGTGASGYPLLERKIRSSKENECNNVNLELKRSAVATIKIKVSNMPSDMEVLEWNINIPYDKLTTMVKFLDDSKGENDVTTSYSLTSFIRGIGQDGVVNYQPKPNYILISKNSL